MIENVYPLSPLQEGMYYHWLLDPSSSAYGEQLIYTTYGEMDVDKLRESYRKLVARHAILRTFFTQELGDKALQVVLKEVPDTFAYQDCTNPDGPNGEEYRKADLAKGFDLQKGSQMRLSVMKVGEQVHQFLWSFHHILLDGWCINLLVRDFYQFYKGLLDGIEPIMETIYPYVNYIQWLGKINQAECMGYWKTYLQGYDALCTLPKLYNTTGQYTLQETDCLLPIEKQQAMRKLCAEMRITESVFFQTIWGLLLGIYNNSHDVVFGAVVSGRPPEVTGIENMIGLFINTVPVRVTTSTDTTVRALLQQVKEESVKGSRYHYTQLGQIQAEVGGNAQLFDHILVYENHPVQSHVADQQGEQTVSPVNASGDVHLLGLNLVQQTNYGFNVILLPHQDAFVVRFNYNRNEYAEQQISQIQNNLFSVFDQVIANPDILARDINCLSPEEEEQLLSGFNNNALAYHNEKTVVQLFEQQAILTPENKALAFDDAVMTYRQLNEAANQVAHFLRNGLQVGHGDIVAIQLPRSHTHIVAILGVLKAGAAYLPIDLDAPPERVANMMADSQCKTVINETALQEALPQISIQPTDNLALLATADSLMYVMYTSGTTGTPKGVMVQHKAFGNLCAWHVARFGITPNDKATLYAGVAFDASVWEIFPYLISGAALYIVPAEIRLDMQALSDFYEANGITISFLPTQVAEQFMQTSNQSLRYLLTGGDKLNNFLPQAYEVVNNYGPTENAVVATSGTVTAQESNIPIGRPIANVQVYILNNHLRLCPMGVPGELCIAGHSLAQGYLNRPELTAEKFVDNPFRPGEKMYRTGDICRWLPDGNLAFLGRKDEQVKIRGFRIELGEIESVLRSYPDIDDAVVTVREDANGDKELVGYITGPATLDNVATISGYLGNLLPFYMVPTYFVQLPQLPLNSNGKVDRKQLPNPEGLGVSTGVEYITPRNETEQKLLKIWQDLLGKEKISIKDNFFAIGGHSLKATKLMSTINKVFDVKLPLPVLFSNPTIEGIASEMEKIFWANNELFDIEDADNISI